MRGYVVAALLVGILSLYAVKFRYKNNVCKTFDDYYTNRDQNENCYYNPDWDLSVVSLEPIYLLFCFFLLSRRFFSPK